jgi:hypothetical protein
VSVAFDQVLDDRARLGDRVAVLRDDRRLAERMDLQQLRRREARLRVALVMPGLVYVTELIEESSR